MSMPDSLQVSALRKQIAARNGIVANITNLTRTIFKRDVVVKYYEQDGVSVTQSFGLVNEVVREGVEVFVVIRSLPVKVKGKMVSKGKPKRVPVDQVIGVMAEREE